MKRLLLPLLAAFALPTAVNAFPWGSDIVVKTDIGEKYIVKDSTVTEINMTKFKKQQNLLQEAKYEYSNYTSAMDEAANCAIEERKKYDYLKDVPLGNPPPKTIYEIRDNVYTWKPKYQKFYQQKLSINCGYKLERAKRKEKETNKATEEWNEYKNNLKKGDINNVKKFRFRPIFEDLNGKKVGLDYEEISCVNKNLSIEEQTRIIFLSGEKFPYIDGTAIEQMKAKVCEKYAKFE